MEAKCQTLWFQLIQCDAFGFSGFTLSFVQGLKSKQLLNCMNQFDNENNTESILSDTPGI